MMSVRLHLPRVEDAVEESHPYVEVAHLSARHSGSLVLVVSQRCCPKLSGKREYSRKE